MRFLPLFLLFPFFANAQSSKALLGVEFQVYPTGVLPGLQLELPLSQHHSVHARAGYNLVRHRDLGKHDDERGGGWGGSLGYRYKFGNTESGWRLGTRSDVWFNRIDWQTKNLGGVVINSGTTDITVVQPTAELSYLFLKNNSNWYLSPSVAFGAEVNVSTKGEPTGEGFILLLGIGAGMRF